jgi:hypothetical protein
MYLLLIGLSGSIGIMFFVVALALPSSGGPPPYLRSQGVRMIEWGMLYGQNIFNRM